MTTYARLASACEIPRGARVVARALAQNPFPLIIPCHRTVRSDGNLGGYQGGLAMKKALLEYEGIKCQMIQKSQKSHPDYFISDWKELITSAHFEKFAR